jgi:hypothetical protein
MGGGGSNNLAQYLSSAEHDREGLDELVRLFSEMIYQKHFNFSIVCFYETLLTDFSKVIDDLPPEFKRTLNGKTIGIVS